MGKPGSSKTLQGLEGAWEGSLAQGEGFFSRNILERIRCCGTCCQVVFVVFSLSCSFKVRRNRAIDVLAEAQKVWYSENLLDQLLVSKAVGLVFPLLT